MLLRSGYSRRLCKSPYAISGIYTSTLQFASLCNSTTNHEMAVWVISATEFIENIAHCPNLKSHVDWEILLRLVMLLVSQLRNRNMTTAPTVFWRDVGSSYISTT